MTVRDEQIAELRRRTEHLRPDRLEECYSAIKAAYDSEGVIDSLARVTEESDRTPSDFRVLSNSETRRLTEFNDESYHWDHFCKQLGRSVSHGERRYFFEQLGRIYPKGQPVNLVNPNFSRIIDANSELISAGYRPNSVCIPISLFIEFMQDFSFPVDVSSPREILTLSGGQSLAIHWSSGLAPLDKLVVFDSTQILWKVKPDPITGHRLTVVIGEPIAQPNTVRFIAETIVECEILDSAAVYSISVEGAIEGPDQP